LEIIETMSLPFSQTLFASMGLLLATSLSWGQPSLAMRVQGLPETDFTFIHWLTAENQDENEDSKGKRGDRLCVVNFPSGSTRQVWSDRPLFVVQGPPRSLALYRNGEDEPFWRYPVTQANAIAYSGPPLSPGITYTLRVEHFDFPSTQFEQRQFVLISEDNRIARSRELAELENQMREDGKSEEAIVIARATHLWQQGLLADAWAQIIPLTTTSSEISDAVETAYEQQCG
jgi:hypothetical protein